MRCWSRRSSTSSSARASPSPAGCAALVDGLEEIPALVAPYTPERVAPQVGIPAEAIARLARDFAAAPSAVCYGRMGTCVQEFGATTTWLVDVLNIATGNLDRPGGAMFTTPAADLPRVAAMLGTGGALRPLPEPRLEPARVQRRAPGRVLRRGDRDARGRTGARAADARREPRPLAPERSAPRPRLREARVHGRDRRLPERDDAPRRPDPSADLRARARALSGDLPRRRDPQHGALFAGRAGEAGGQPARLGDPGGADRAARARARRPRGLGGVGQGAARAPDRPDRPARR